MDLNADRLSELVQWDKGLISPEIFISDSVYQQELEVLFSRAWLFLAHDSMIAKPGDFFTTYMGGDPVVIARQHDGSVKAFLNVCRHRGLKLCRAEDGNAKTFTCTYHGWAFDIAGKLVSVPNHDDAYHCDLKQEEWGLIEVAQLDHYKGFWFATFDKTAPPLAEYLSDMRYWIDSWADHLPGGIEILPGTIKWTIEGNWKLGAEQFAGDGYHAAVSHVSSFSLIEPSLFAAMPPGGQYASREGHGFSYIYAKSRFSDDPIARYNQERRTKMEAHLGDDRASMIGNFTVFPNLSGLPGSANLRVWHPKGPNKFEIWSFTVVDKNAPDEVKKRIQRSAGFTEGPAGIVEVDDGEQWNNIGFVLKHGVQARKMMWNYTMGLGHETEDHPVARGKMNRTYFGEGPQRAFYRRWLEFMTSKDWPRIEPEAPATTTHAQASVETATVSAAHE
ncbi:MAG TPA: aromatic ring-hydroxylating dioxygenase subunit alpha [Pararobbsia sp.]|nr:aromatic ring-hydroxylating dioxygenase subunit alpha [Pararobbsia sp.]